MANESLDTKLLGALHLISKDIDEGVNYMEFVKQGLMEEALDLLGKGYAIKIKKEGDDANYRLTLLGGEYVKKIMQFAQGQF